MVRIAKAITDLERKVLYSGEACTEDTAAETQKRKPRWRGILRGSLFQGVAEGGVHA